MRSPHQFILSDCLGMEPLPYILHVITTLRNVLILIGIVIYQYIFNTKNKTRVNFKNFFFIILFKLLFQDWHFILLDMHGFIFM